MNVLLTGGAGYIGTHTAVELLDAGHGVVLVDSLANSHEEAVRRVEHITGERVAFHRADCTDPTALRQVFAEYEINAVLLMAGLKAVGESVSLNLRYYSYNMVSLL